MHGSVRTWGRDSPALLDFSPNIKHLKFLRYRNTISQFRHAFYLYINTVFDKSDFYKIISIYQRFEDRKLNHNMLYPPYFFRLRIIGQISCCFFDVNY